MKYNKHRSIYPKPRGGWTKDKIKKALKTSGRGSYGEYGIYKNILDYNDYKDFADHIYYHGTGSYVGSALKPSILVSDREIESLGGGGYGEKYWGVSLSKSKNISSNFTSNSRSGSVYLVLVKKGAKVISMPDVSDANELEDFIEDLWDKGVDAVKIGDWSSDFSEQEIVVLNPRVLYTYSKPFSFSVFGKGKFENLSLEEVKEIYESAESKSNKLSEIESKHRTPSNSTSTREERDEVRYLRDSKKRELIKPIVFRSGGVIDRGGRNIVYSGYHNYEPYEIAIDDKDNPSYITLWYLGKGDPKKVGYLELSPFNDFMKISIIDIGRGHRNKGLGSIMYLAALNNINPKYKGLVSYTPDRSNKRQVPKIYKKFKAVSDGDYQFIYRKNQDYSGLKIKFKNGGLLSCSSYFNGELSFLNW